MPANAAAWLTARYADLTVAEAAHTPPRAGELVVRVRAVAVNPVDWIKQTLGDMMFSWVKYPAVLGSDVAGEVLAVGEGVGRFSVGDRVLGHAVGLDKSRNTPAEGAFQEQVVLLDRLTSPIPAALSFESAAVVPLGLSTAACGLFQKDQLGLQPPSASPSPTGKTLIVWGGSTSVGSNAIQLALAAGYEVISTASPVNFDYVAGLGASRVFDYRSRTVVADMVAALGGKTIAGALAIGKGSAELCLDVVRRCHGDKVIAMASPAVAFDGVGRPLRLNAQFLGLIAKMISAQVALQVRARLAGVRTAFVFGSTLMNNEVGPMIYEAFLPSALAEGRFVAAPPPQVVGQGLGQIQAALEAQKRGVSARKIVVTL
jgi:NADPH:quinone reductase-like Zn-dependent oxidoreductase